ncbi:MAG: TolC family protein [Bacteroidota bacterium]
MRNLLLTIFLFSYFLALSQEKKVLSLEECIEIAIENNLNVRGSELSLQNARINYSQAKAQRLPTLNGQGNYGFNWGRSIDPNTNDFVNQRINFNSIGFNSSTPVLQGMQVTNGVKQAGADLFASEYDLQRARNDISLNVASLYLTVILNKELVENAEFQLESAKQQLDQTKKLVASGALPIANELQLESQVATNEVTLINNQNALDLSLLDLKQALLLPPGEEIDLIIPDVQIDEDDLQDVNPLSVYNYALANQPEIKAAEERVKSADLGLAIAKGAMIPSLSLNGTFNTNYSDAQDQIFRPDGGFEIRTNTTSNLTILDDSSTPVANRQIGVISPTGTIEDYTVLDQWDDNLRYSVSLGLFVPILNGFNNRSNLQRAKVSVQQSELNAIGERNALYQTVETSYRNALATNRTYIASLKQVASLEETYRAVENQYNNGAANFTDYQVAANNLFQAQSDLSRAKYDFIFRKKILDFYLGKSLSF